MHHRFSQRGSILIEVLIAALIFAGAIIVLLEFQSNLLRDRGLLNQESKALSLAQDKMQSFRQYTALTTTPGQFAYEDIQSGSSTVTGNSATYQLSWVVEDHADLPPRKTVTVTVQWTDASNASHSLSISSVIAEINPTATGNVSMHLP